ncbi:MAG: hypothetical protein ACD_81C00190G0009 [uncultured bacterium]|uniref:Methyltransferase, FkbM family n=1 Tax=Candidatus Wolfebacteria bacterium GW2011_GWC2_39_22 TaxID=1619013 RepID=A0A0G0RG40_9BACT|nr:MAG: hypothetical protein ACD_81C00190G0009 [uncultured bacterium]KKR12597.1 MAG: Methyltransferase, FkbM family [Candidatus Wolfebacteria bacterium GW2011_GWC2_39_22]HBI25798.1 hypothetical protein [Candidatus Wolfebacteria bacterium]
MELVQNIKNIIKKTPLFKPLTYVKTALVTGQLPVKPPTQEQKKEVIFAYADIYGLTVFVETGTHTGDMVESCKNKFKEIYSVELSDDFYAMASSRFVGDEHIHLYKGDSGEVIKEIVPLLSAPTLFWLDAHFSGGRTARGDSDTPIMQELNCILKNCKQPLCILIDDARLFVGKNDYPHSRHLKKMIRSEYPHLTIAIKGDIIRIYPKTS